MLIALNTARQLPQYRQTRGSIGTHTQQHALHPDICTNLIREDADALLVRGRAARHTMPKLL
jgi:hypothetical protein